MRKTTIFVFDDFSLLRHGWCSFLSTNNTFSIVGETASEIDALACIRKRSPDIILFDRPFSQSDLATVHKKMKAHAPRSKTIYMPLKIRPFMVEQMVQQNLNGCISKQTSLEELVAGIEQVSANHVYFCKNTRQQLVDYALHVAGGDVNLSLLSKRELEIAELITHGKTSKQISVQLSIAHKTVDVHRHRILTKLQLKNMAALVNLMMQ